MLAKGPFDARSGGGRPDSYCLLAGNFLRRSRRPKPKSPAMSVACRRRNPTVARPSGRGTGNLTGAEQGTNRSLSGRNRERTGGENGARDRARPGCKASVRGLMSILKAARYGADRVIVFVVMPANAGIQGGERRNLAIGHAGPRQGSGSPPRAVTRGSRGRQERAPRGGLAVASRAPPSDCDWLRPRRKALRARP